MRTQINFPIVVLALTLAIVVGTAVLGSLGPLIVDSQAPTSATLPAISRFFAPVLSILLLSAIAGVLGWLALFFLLRRDGWHRMESVAMLPLNYGDRSPFDTSPWN